MSWIEENTPQWTKILRDELCELGYRKPAFDYWTVNWAPEMYELVRMHLETARTCLGEWDEDQAIDLFSDAFRNAPGHFGDLFLHESDRQHITAPRLMFNRFAEVLVTTMPPQPPEAVSKPLAPDLDPWDLVERKQDYQERLAKTEGRPGRLHRQVRRGVKDGPASG